MSRTMRAMILTGHGDLDRLAWREDWPRPVPGPGEVLIEVSACGLNNTDVNTRIGWYSKAVSGATSDAAGQPPAAQDPSWGGRPITFPRIQGADVVGTAVLVGAGAAPDLVGRRVLVDPWLRDPVDPLDMDRAGFLGSEIDGGFAEYTTVRADMVHPVDCGLTDAELATFATSYVTAENMLNRAAVATGDVVLVPGASGGVGSALVQLANRRGATTVAMCSQTKADAVRAIGPAAVLPRAPADLKVALRDAVGRDTVTVVADVVAGPVWPQLIDVIARNGRYVCSGAIAGPVVELDLRTFYLRDLTLIGSTVVPPGTFADLVGSIERDEVRPLLAATYPLRDLRAAQAAFIAKDHVGNIVVQP